MSDISKKPLYLSFVPVFCLFIFCCILYAFLNLLLNIDDTFISFCFVRNFADGHGFVFNPGGERVEGFSNLLWVLILSIPAVCKINILQASLWLGIFFSALTIFLLLKIVFSCREKMSYFWVAGVFCALNPSFLYYTLSGMETALYCFLILFSVFFILKEISQRTIMWSGIFLFLTAITRPEGILFLIGCFCYLCFFVKDCKKLLILLSVQFGILFGFYLLFKYLYFGDIFPTAYYVKVANLLIRERLMRGFIYSYVFFKDNLFFLFLLGASFFLAFKEKQPLHCLVFILVVFQIGFIIYAGGDAYHFDQWRFFVPIILLLLLLLPDLMNIIFQRIPCKIVRFLVGLLLVCVYFLTTDMHLIKSRFDEENRKEIKNNPSFFFKQAHQFFLGINHNLHANIGRWIDENYPKNTVVASDQAGQIPFYSRIKFVDLVGLTTKKIAGVKGQSKDYFNLLEDFAPDLFLLFPEEVFVFSDYLEKNKYQLVTAFSSSSEKKDIVYLLFGKNGNKKNRMDQGRAVSSDKVVWF